MLMSGNAAAMLEELSGKPERPAPTMGAVVKVSYTHLDMIDYLLANPGHGLKELSARYGYTMSWLCNIQASDAWKCAYAKRREELIDPVLLATLNERFEGMTLLSLERLTEKLSQPQVSDNVVLKAVELGAKALGVGGNAAPPAPPTDHLAQLANRLIDLQSKIRERTIDGTAQEVTDAVQVAG